MKFCEHENVPIYSILNVILSSDVRTDKRKITL